MPRQRSWTDEQLAEAVAASATYKEVMERTGAGSYVGMRVRIAELGLDDQHLRRAARQRRTVAQRERRAQRRADGPVGGQRTWSDDDLRAAVAQATSLNGVFRLLGLVPGGAAWQRMQDHIRRLGLDTDHWTQRAARGGVRRTWTDEDLLAAADGARSMAEIMRRLGLSDRGGGSRQTVRRRMRALGLDPEALPGQGWSRGTRQPSAGPAARPLDEILVSGSSYATSRLRERLVEEGIRERRCEICGGTQWNGRPIPLQLDHINGDRRDHRLVNLRILCPNCHAQTDTYCAKNRGRYDG